MICVGHVIPADDCGAGLGRAAKEGGVIFGYPRYLSTRSRMCCRSRSRCLQGHSSRYSKVGGEAAARVNSSPVVLLAIFSRYASKKLSHFTNGIGDEFIRAAPPRSGKSMQQTTQ